MYVVTLFPYVMMTILLINGALLDGAGDGIEYYLNPDFDKLANGQVIIPIFSIDRYSKPE